MAYIGPEPNPGQNREVDDISSGFNGSEVNFTLQVNSQNVSPGSPNNIIVSLGGVVQNPSTDYNIAASTITFTTAPASGLSFFGLVLGQQVDIQSLADGTSPTMSAPTITGDLSIADKIVHTGDTNTAIRFPAADTITAETGGNERLRVDSSGNVGIGITPNSHGGTVKSLQIGTATNLYNETSDDYTILGNNVYFNGTNNKYIKTQESSRLIQNAGEFTFQQAVSGSADANITYTTPLKIDSSGNLAVNVTSASAGGNSYRTVISDTIGSNEQLLGLQYLGVVTYGINAEQNGDLTIKRDGVQRCVLTNVGRFLINTTTVIDSSSAQLVVKGTFPVTPIEIQQSSSGNHFAITFNNSNGLVGAIRTNGSTTHFDTSSDYRLKENAVAISDGITRLKTLKPYRFNFKADASKTVDGFFAHEVTAVPEAINGTKDEVDSDNNPVYQGIDQSKLVPLLTAALQEAVAKIETLETKVAALEAA